jgi:ubiquinone/menaquinone biosynthesis C-methylase UbiE
MYLPLAAAFVRGKLGAPAGAADGSLLDLRRPLASLDAAELEQVVALGDQAGLRLHKFKRTMELPRVKRVLGILHGLGPATLLDVGSGRGTFLWPLVDAFPHLPVLAIDSDERRVADLSAVRMGGVDSLSAAHMNAAALDLADGSYDVVTMLEVLEHIPQAQLALNEAVRVARRFVVLSVPSQPDNNPEHIHLFSRADIASMLQTAGARRISVDYVLNHMIVVAGVGGP